MRWCRNESRWIWLTHWVALVFVMCEWTLIFCWLSQIWWCLIEIYSNHFSMRESPQTQTTSCHCRTVGHSTISIYIYQYRFFHICEGDRLNLEYPNKCNLGHLSVKCIINYCEYKPLQNQWSKRTWSIVVENNLNHYNVDRQLYPFSGWPLLTTQWWLKQELISTPFNRYSFQPFTI